ncbi:MAG: substrate-binding domain-containing protein [Bacillota bacterium]
MKKILSIVIAGVLLAAALTGCASGSSGPSASPEATQSAATPENTQAAGSDFDSDREISVISREDGSGTRGAFIELFGVEAKNEAGEKVDRTTEEAAITNSTSVMMTSVAGDKYAIGYISLGSLNDTVKAAKIDGVDASAANIEAGTYKISRPFNIATKEGLSDLGKDFIAFILSSEGQKVIENNGYIAAVKGAAAYAGTKPSGKIVIAGSSSVTPVMEKLKEAYLAINANAEIEIQQSDSSTGMTSTIDGICDIGMASRELKDSELQAGLTPTVIATDGIAVIINKENPVDGFAKDQVLSIYTGETTLWSDILG